MDSIGAFLDGDQWDCFQKMFAAEEFEFTSHPFLLGQDEEVDLGFHSMVCPPLEVNISMLEGNENLVYSSESLNSYCSVESISQQNTYNYLLSTHAANILASDHPNYMYMDIPSVEEICGFSSSSLADMMMEDTADRLDEEIDGNIAGILMNPLHQPDQPLAIPGNQMTLKRKLEAQELPGCAEDKSNTSAENRKKKPRVSREVQRTKRNAQPKKSRIADANVEEEIQAATSAGQTDSSCSTEEDSGSQEMNGGVSNSSCNASAAFHHNGKTRASRGSATDPQSLYARKRRERINERLRILQTLVPNGTKVDISTMLEEAVHYVKFLQLQIKLLSSDDHWMYSPIAYNGMDMGLNLHMKIPSPL